MHIQKISLSWICSLSLFMLAPSYCLVDLEALSSECVITTKQVVISAYPHAFNPSIIRWKGEMLMCFRVIPDPKKSFESWLGLIWLDENFEPISLTQKLQLRNPDSLAPSRVEDGRLIEVNGSLFLVYSDNEDREISKGGFRVYVAKLQEKNGLFSVEHIERLSSFQGNSPNKREKNWVPFTYNNKLLLAYSLSPHLIFTPVFNTNTCKTVSYSPTLVPWDWGDLRGGTGALLDGDQYIAFFHSCIRMSSIHTPKECNHYFMGAYTFTRDKPFTITQISKQPIIGKDFYHGAEYKPYWGTVRVVFPCGFVADDDYFWVAYGRQDHEMWIAQIDKKKLYKSLIPVKYKHKTSK